MNKKLLLLASITLILSSFTNTDAYTKDGKDTYGEAHGTAPGYDNPPSYDDLFDEHGNERVPQQEQQPDQEDEETKNLRKRLKNLERKEADRETKKTIESFLALLSWYKQSLQNRWDKPETEQQYHQLIQELSNNIQNTVDSKTKRMLRERLKEVTNNEWKNGWCSRNPFKCDMCKAGGVIVTLGGIVYFVGGSGGGGQG